MRIGIIIEPITGIRSNSEPPRFSLLAHRNR